MFALLAFQLDLNVIGKILSIISEFLVRNIFFLLSHLKLAVTLLQTVYFTQTLLLSGDINLNPRPTHNSQIDGLSENVLD